ncbi:C40 family peptidase [Anthocerotibacter panamensis]|uniref:C40 family peptidase n=1 Tax=Anthocerotibacter panamensis TaxID=2857077 RepID=UPI001C407CEF|nr:C40 family peptidase [Anthocerotibacter panamensis]
MNRRFFLSTAALLSLPPKVLGAPMTDLVEVYKKQLPPNYGPGAVLQVQAVPQLKGTRLTGRVLTLHDKQTLGALFAPLGPVENQLQSFPYREMGAASYGVLTAQRSDMRSQADAASELVSQAVLGDTVLLLSQTKDWYEILRQWDGYVGWVPKADLKTLDQNQLRQWRAQSRQMLLKDTPIGFAGSILTGKTAPDRRPLVETLSPSQMRERVLTHAQALYEHSRVEPFPYLWGGTYGTALDCSGFTQTVYRLAGLAIPRDTYQQLAFGEQIKATPVRLDLLLPGDLVFFSENSRRATHVGIYMGEGMLYHSSGSKGNRGLDRNNLRGDLPYEAFLRRIWWGVARFIPAEGTTPIGTQGLFLDS